MDNNFKCSSYLNRVRYDYFSHNDLYIVLEKESNFNLIDLNYMINKYKCNNIHIMNTTSYYDLKNVFKVVKNINYDGNVIIDLCESDIRGENIIPPILLNFENRDRLDISNFPNNVKIHAFSSNNSQTEFTTWSHNLNEKNKLKLYNVLTNEDKKIFLNQEHVIKDEVTSICEENPMILSLDKNKQFNLIIDYIKNNYDINNKIEKGRGVSFEIADFLTLISNNSYLKLNVCSVLGKYKKKKYYWNEFINNNNEVFEYDLLNDIYNISTLKGMEKKGYEFDRVYPLVINLKKKNNEIKNTNHFSNPLPKNKKKMLIPGNKLTF